MPTAGAILAKMIKEKDSNKREKLRKELEKQSSKQLDGTKVIVEKKDEE